MRRRLLDAALQVFAERGYDAASVEEVAAAAGFTKAAVYSNFGGKDDLFLALMDAQITSRVEAARRAVAEMPVEPRSADALARVGQVLTEALTREREWQLLFLDYWRRAVRDESVRRRFRQHRRALRASIAAAIGPAVPEAPGGAGLGRHDVVTVVLAVSNGLAIERLTGPATVPDDLFGRILTALAAAG